jgi:hypothetical protein
MASSEDSELGRLSYGRVVGAAGAGPVRYTTVGETLLVGLAGLAFVVVDDEVYEVNPLDAVLVPGGGDVQVHADGSGCDVMEISWPADERSTAAFLAFDQAELPKAPWRPDVRIGAAARTVTAAEGSERLLIWLGATELDGVAIAPGDCLVAGERVALAVEVREPVRYLLVTASLT